MDFLRRSRRQRHSYEAVQQPVTDQSIFEFLRDRPSESELFLYGPVSALRPHPRRRFARDKFALALSAIAGFVDAAGFATLFGLFPAHLTGELVSIVGELSPKLHIEIWERLGLIAVFVSAVALAAAVARWSRRWSHLGRPQLAPLFTLLTASLLLFCGLGVAFEWTGRVRDGGLEFLASASAVAAMGVQNALMRVGLNTCLPTTVMTGNLTQATVEVVELLGARLNPTAEERVRGPQNSQRLARALASLTSFTFGAGLAIVSSTFIGLWCMLVPATLAATLAAIAWREHLEPA